MIVDALLDFLQGAVSWVVGLFPASSFDPFEYFAMGLSNLGALNYFLPLTEMLVVFVGFWALTPTWVSVTLGLWLFSQIRGSSSVG